MENTYNRDQLTLTAAAGTVQGAAGKSVTFVPKTEQVPKFLFVMGFTSKSFMFSKLMSCMALFEKIAISLHNGLDPLPEPPAGLGQGVPGEGAQHLHDLGRQGLHIVVGAPGFVHL